MTCLITYLNKNVSYFFASARTYEKLPLFHLKLQVGLAKRNPTESIL